MAWLRLMIAVVLLASLFVAACRTGADFGSVLSGEQKKGPPTIANTSSEQSLVEPSPAAQEPTSTEQKEQIAKLENITEVATYDVKNSCKKDTAGIVRTFDENGKKSVYRPFCDGKGLVTFTCVQNKSRASTSNCPNGCMLDERADAVCRKSPIPPRNPDPLRTSGTALDRTLGTSNG